MGRVSLSICLMLLVATSTFYEVQSSFLLRAYMRNFPGTCNQVQPFACQGMLKFVELLQMRCPLNSQPAYSNFFGKLKSYMSFIASASGSANFDVQLKGQAQGLHSAMATLGGRSGSMDSSKVIETLMSMGRTLMATRRSGAVAMSFGEKKELIMSMVRWAQTISQFVSSITTSSGASFDTSSLGLDGIDVNLNAGGGGGASMGGRASGTTTGNYNAGTSFNQNNGGSLSGGTSGTTTGNYNTGGSFNHKSGGSSQAGYNANAGGSVNLGSSTQGGNYRSGTTSSNGNVLSGSQAQAMNGGRTTCITTTCKSGSSFQGGGSFQGGASFQGGGSFQGSANYQQH